MKKFLFFFLLLMGTLASQAYDFSAVAPTGQTLYYNISGSTVAVTFPYGDYTAPTGNLSIPETVTYNGNTYSVTSIGVQAFVGCSGLTSVTIPNSVTSIGIGAFSGCSGLTSVTIGDSVTIIGYDAFYGCYDLMSVTIPNSVTSIGQQAFFMVKNIVYYGNAIGGPWGALNINGYIEGDLVYNNETKTEVTGCNTSATRVTVPNSVTSIGYMAFFNCSNLTSVTMGNSVTYIGDEAFGCCGNLTSVNYTGSIGGWCGISFANEYSNPIRYAGNLSINGVPVTSIQIPNTVTRIGQYAFDNLGSLINVTIPNSVTSIGDYAFANCRLLTSVTLPSSVTNIGWFAFGWCGLTSVTIPNSVISIGDYAFYANNITTVYSKNPIAPILGMSCFESNTIQNIHIPCGSWNSYYSEWSEYSTYLQEPLSASFVRNLHSTDTAMGFVELLTIDCADTSTIKAVPNYGYHFTQWNDGMTDNPRTFVLTQDTSFTAEFYYNQYVVSGVSANEVMGEVSGRDTVDYLQSVTLTATANYGYHFTQWNDGVTDNPRTVVANSNKSYTAEFGYNTYVVAKSCDTIQGTIEGVAEADYLSNVTLTAVPNYGYHFTQWNDGVTENPRTFVLTQDTSFTAEFDYNQYVVSGASANEVMGDVSGSDTVDYLQSVTLTATANYGYHFTQWNDGNIDNPRTIVADSNKIYTAEFGYNTYVVAKSCDTIQGTIEGVAEAEYLSNVALTAIPNYGYHFTQWSDGVPDNPRTFVLTQDTAFTAEFGYNQYTITGTSANSAMGSTVGDSTVDYLQYVTITAVPNYGYHFTQWSDGNTENPRTIQALEDKNYTAQFTYNTYTITKLCNTVKGGISGNSSSNYLSNVTLTAIPNYGYHFTQWSDGNTDNPRTFVLTQDTVFTAEFDYNQYTISVLSENGTLGTVTGGGDYLYLDTVMLTATAVDHYHFAHWQDGNTENPRAVVVMGDADYTAIFEIDVYHIAVESSDLNMGYVSGGGDVTYGQPVTVEATAYSGYHFSCWSNGSRYNPYTFASIQDLTLQAIFVSDEAPYYTITVAANNAAMGSATGSGTYDAGTVALITAVPSEGCAFLHWNDGSTVAERLVEINATATYTAFFAPEQCNVNTTTNLAAAGTVSGNGTYNMGDTVTLTATANDGYRFDHWNDGSTEEVRTVVIDENLSAEMQLDAGNTYGITFTAYFVDEHEGIDDASLDEVRVYVAEGAIVVSVAENERVRVYDLSGRVVAEGRSEGMFRYEAPCSGVYFVRAGIRKAQKVVVVK